jgi:hypothetical protein
VLYLAYHNLFFHFTNHCIAQNTTLVNASSAIASNVVPFAPNSLSTSKLDCGIASINHSFTTSLIAALAGLNFCRADISLAFLVIVAYQSYSKFFPNNLLVNLSVANNVPISATCFFDISSFA